MPQLSTSDWILVLGFLLAAGLVFFPLWTVTAKIWFEPDTYYSHGPLIPFCAAYVIYENWDRLKVLPRRGWWPAAVPIAALLFTAWVASRTVQQTVLSMSFLLIIIFSIWFVAGLQWVWKTLAPTLFLVFALPIWGPIIDRFTNPLQQISTKGTSVLLTLFGMHPIPDGSTILRLDNYTLDVGVPCSGLKLLLAVTAITMFFMMIAKMRWWAYVLLAVFALPLTIFVNSVRIAMIGVVGNTWGEAAGAGFHDYSGYISLILCFFIFSWVTRRLECKA